MAAVPIIIAAEKLFEAALWVTGLLAAGVVVEKAVDAAKESEDVFDQKETKACVTCGTPPLEHPPVESGPTPFPADSQELPNHTESPNMDPVGVSDTGGQEAVDTGPNEYNYIPPPRNIPGIPDLSLAKPKTSILGGGGKLRKRWKDKKGNIFEWDYQHGTLEKYNKRGKHQGEFNPDTGEQTKPADKTRKVEP